MKLLDYIRGLRKGKEAHRLEKESMKDPFLADAMDGYHLVEGDHEQEIKKLRMKVTAHSAKRRNTYAVTWSIAACLILGIGISSYFLFLKQDIGEEMFIAKENIPSVATTPKNEVATTPKSEEATPKDKDIVARTKKIAEPQKAPSATVPVMEETVTPMEMQEKTAATTATDSAIFESNKRKMKASQLIAQTYDMIKGKVTDEKGEPIIGAAIYYKGSNLGTITNLDGEFTLPKKKNEKMLTAQCVGYEPISIPIDNNKPMHIAMYGSSEALDEVVVTGYTAQRKVSVVGAVSTVSTKELKKTTDSLQNADTLKDADISQDADTLQSPVVPKPVTGMKQYKKYLKKNLIYPTDDACAEVKGKVTLTFFVSREGRPYDIKVKESLCKSLDKEAIRLIQEGPDWTYGNKAAEITVKFQK